MTIRFSRYLAIVLGILTPFGETIRRWSTWRENPPAFFDDYIIGALLLYGAWRVGKDARSGQPFLVAGWAFMCGMAYGSFFNQVHDYRLGISDPAPISSFWIAVIKGTGLALGIIGLIASLRVPKK
jgi:small-conductance mechanosensitive channel